MARYVALLRGINVGGKNLIRMADLKACFEKHGCEEVATYIQSGNVLFSSSGSRRAELVRGLEALLAKSFSYRASLVLRTDEELRAIVEEAPEGFGATPESYRYDVIFLKEPLEATAAIEEVPVKEGVDAAHVGPGVLYFSRLIERASESRLSKLVSLRIYASVTIRNWNTTTKLLSLMG